MFTSLPHNVLDDIVLFADRPLQLVLAQLSHYLRHRVYLHLYKHITIVDSTNVCASSTLVCTDRVQHFAACLNHYNFSYVKRIVVNTHGNCTLLLVALYEKLASLWNSGDHAIEFVNYDVVSLRAANLLNDYLNQHSLLVMDIDEEDCIVTRKDHKSLNLRNWFATGTGLFAAAPFNDQLRQLNLYVESNAYGSVPEPIQAESADALRNLAGLSDVFLHSPLAYLKFGEMLDNLGCPRLNLLRLSVTSSHRVRNNAPLDFAVMNRYFNLNALEELEIQACCLVHHECSNTCILRFFEDWRIFNDTNGYVSNLKKFALVNYKTMGEAVQFKDVVEHYVLSPLFPALTECYLNFDLSTTALSMDWSNICRGLAHVPNLKVLHLSKFVNDWLRGIRDVVQERNHESWDVMVNRCSCHKCCRYRSSFSELARVDKRNHYNHKVRLGDIDTNELLTGKIDFNIDENVKYLYYVAGQLRKEEVIMEQNLHSTGTMLNMDDMPRVHNKELDPFRALVKHSCLEDVFEVLRGWAPLLERVNFGGIVVTKKSECV